MEQYVASLIAFGVAVFLLSVGVIFGDRKIKGHCGSPSLKEGCVKDIHGNKIASCDSCDCETTPLSPPERMEGVFTFNG